MSDRIISLHPSSKELKTTNLKPNLYLVLPKMLLSKVSPRQGDGGCNVPNEPKADGKPLVQFV